MTGAAAGAAGAAGMDALCRGGVLRQTAQLPNDVPYRHPNETADARFFFIF